MEPEQNPGARTIIQGDQASSESRALSLPEEAVQHPEAPVAAGYLLAARLGAGTYGEVWRAWQVRTRKWVALKVYTRREGLDWTLLRREVERLGQLDKHPYVVSLLDADLEAQPPYCALELVAGGALEGRRAPDAETAAGWLEKVAEALAFVHSRGVIHCDLKPANILLDEDGRPRVADFGQARAAGGESALGSFFYMAPEQAAPSSERARLAPDVRWDVYALGATAYAVLTGRAPHEDFVGRALERAPGRDLDSRLRAYRAAVQAAGAPALPAWVDADLAAIVRKCLEPEPARRYSSAGMVLFDLRNRRAGLPVTPLAGDAGYRARKFVRRNALLVAVAGAGALALLAAGAQIVSERDRLKTQLAAAFLGQAQLQAELGNAVGAVSYSAESNRLLPSHLARANTLAYLAEVAVPRRVVSGTRAAASRDGGRLAAAYQGRGQVWDPRTGETVGAPMPHPREVSALAISPDGRRVATGCEDGLVRLWDGATGRPQGPPLPHRGPVVALAFSADGRWLASGSEDGTAMIWDAAAGRAAGGPLRHKDHVHSLAFFPDGRRLATASEEDHTLRVWSVPEGRPLIEPIDLKSKIYDIAVSPDGRSVALAGLDKTARLYDAATGRPRLVLKHEGRVLSVVFSPDGRKLLTSGFDERARLWDARTGAEIGPSMRHEGTVRSAEFSPDGRYIVTASADNSARVWDAATQLQYGPPYEHASIVQAAEFLGSGGAILTRSTGGMARVWSVHRPEQRSISLPHENNVYTIAYSGDGKVLVTASKDGTAKLWSADGRLLRALTQGKSVRAAAISRNGALVLAGGHAGASLWTADGRLLAETRGREADLVSFSRDGGRALAADRDGAFTVWDAAGRRLASWRSPSRPLFALLSPDGRWAAAGGRDGLVRLWSADDGRALAVMTHDGAVEAGAFFPDGSRLVTASDDRTARLWKLPSGERVVGATMRHKDIVRAVAVSPDGSLIATGGEDQRLRLWDAATGEPRGRKILHRASVRAIAFSPDGATILTGSEDKTARLWDAASGIEIGRPMAHEERVLSVAFSPDGKTAATAGPEKAAHLWPLSWLDEDAAPAELSRRARVATIKKVNAAGDLESFSPEEWRRLARLDGGK